MNARGTETFDVFLQPGEFFFGNQQARIQTLLGSCVAITLWHPRLQQGGMCHFILPGRSGHFYRRHDGRYANDAIALFMRELSRNQTHPSEYEVKLFGGGHMFSKHQHHAPTSVDIGQRNIEAGRRLLREHAFLIKAEHVGGDGHRNIVFDLACGHVWVKHVPELAMATENLSGREGGV